MFEVDLTTDGLFLFSDWRIGWSYIQVHSLYSPGPNFPNQLRSTGFAETKEFLPLLTINWDSSVYLPHVPHSVQFSVEKKVSSLSSLFKKEFPLKQTKLLAVQIDGWRRNRLIAEAERPVVKGASLIDVWKCHGHATRIATAHGQAGSVAIGLCWWGIEHQLTPRFELISQVRVAVTSERAMHDLAARVRQKTQHQDLNNIHFQDRHL